MDTTTNCEVIITGTGYYYARCTRCPWVSEEYGRSHRALALAREAAERHETS